MATITIPLLDEYGMPKRLDAHTDSENKFIDTPTKMSDEFNEQYPYRDSPTKMSEEEIMLEEFRRQLNDFFNEMAEILILKRLDYGTSYDKIRKRFGEIVPLIRLNDKLMRYENLIEKKREPENEPLIDVFLDVIGYCVLEIFYRRSQQ